MQAESSPTWLDLERKYRLLSADYAKKTDEFLAKISKMPSSTPSECRLMIAMSRMASRMAVQARNYEKMANDAKRQDAKELTELDKPI